MFCNIVETKKQRVMNDLMKFEMPNGEIIEVWNDYELKLDFSLEEPFEYYYNFMLSVHGIELKP